MELATPIGEVTFYLSKKYPRIIVHNIKSMKLRRFILDVDGTFTIVKYWKNKETGKLIPIYSETAHFNAGDRDYNEQMPEFTMIEFAPDDPNADFHCDVVFAVT